MPTCLPIFFIGMLVGLIIGYVLKHIEVSRKKAKFYDGTGKSMPM